MLVALPVCKIEKMVAADGAAESETELAPLKKRVPVGGIAVERGLGSQLVVAEEVESGAVEVVASGPRDDVHCSGVGGPGREIEIHRRNLELLDDFL